MRQPFCICKISDNSFEVLFCKNINCNVCLDFESKISIANIKSIRLTDDGVHYTIYSKKMQGGVEENVL